MDRESIDSMREILDHIEDDGLLDKLFWRFQLDGGLIGDFQLHHRPDCTFLEQSFVH